MSDLQHAVTALCALLGGDVDVSGLDAAGLREVLQRATYDALRGLERVEPATDADVRLRAARRARAIDSAWALVRLELEVELGERRRVA